MSTLFAIVLSFLAIFMILLVLVQRGRGGGLAGALGGVGGSSAFGAKAGDVFTKITIVVAALWIFVCVASVYWANNQSDRLGSGGAASVGGASTATTSEAGDGIGESTDAPITAESSIAPADETSGAETTGDAQEQ